MDALHATLAVAREALEPFAKLGRLGIKEGVTDDRPVFDWMGHEDEISPLIRWTAGDFRRAAEALGDD